jgi:NTE family protein
LLRLNELGYLTRIGRISSVSGGSIAAGMLAVAWPTLTRKDRNFTDLDEKVIQPLRAFCRRSIDKAAIGWGVLTPGKSIGDVLADIYDELYYGKSLQELPDEPQFIFNATNLQTGRLVRLSKMRLADHLIGEVPRPDIRVSVAVAASSAFPPVLSPVTIDVDPDAWVHLEGARYWGDPAYTRTLSLTDGGAYDNLGLEPVDDFETVIVSDAGAPFAMAEEASGHWLKQSMRALDIATDQARALRKRLLFAQAAASGRKVAYGGIDGDVTGYPARRKIQVSFDVTSRLARIRTRLDPFSDEEQGQLINWGWLMMDMAMRSYVVPNAEPPTALPLPAPLA